MDIVRVTGNKRVRLKDIDPDSHGDIEREEAEVRLEVARSRIEKVQERLYAEHKQSLLIVFQAIDTGGKDGTIRKVLSGVNPQGCRVWSFKEPTPWEAAHDVFWRYHQVTPAHGMINVFNRSHYEEVLVVRVKDLVPKGVWKNRYKQINQFEEILTENNTRIVKFFLHISKEEQKERLQARLDDPEKRWKFSTSDLADREYWDDYQDAFEDAINNCATTESPWYVVPANHKWYRNYVVAQTIADILEEMDPQWPEQEEDLSGIVIPD